MGIRSLTQRAAFALACVAALLVLGSRNAFWSDYFVEAWPAYFRLPIDGVDDFLRLMPAYSGFATFVGAPTALLQLGYDWTFRINAIPGLLALAGLAVALHSTERAHTVFAIALSAGSPVAYLALDAGHPEDLLAAATAVAGVLAAVRRRAT